MAGKTLLLRKTVGKLIRSVERVGFSDCDPYGHMASHRYLEMAVNHRMSAVTEFLGFDTLQTAKDTRFAFVNRDVRLEFKSSARFDDTLHIDSWIDKASSIKLSVKVRISDAMTGNVHCLITITSLAIDIETMTPVPIPDTYEACKEVDLDALPWAPGHPATPRADAPS